MKFPALIVAALLFAGLPVASSSAYVAVSVGIAPPAIPIYQQPYCPAPGYIWTPGYWSWGDFGYYWVPGVWVLPPRIGLLWTPGYWGYYNNVYRFNQGYWGPTVGFYGGINYGFGYGGSGYYGGEWAGNTFRYNTAVTRVNTTVIHNTYVNRNVVRNTGSRAGFNGPGGATAKPTAREQAAKADRIPPTSAQRDRVDAAKKDPALRAKNNKGKPNEEAVKSFERNHGDRQAREGTKNSAGADKTAGARNEAGTRKTNGAQKQAGGAKRPGTEKAKGGAAQTANHSRPTTRTAERDQRMAQSKNHQSAQREKSSQASRKAAAPQAARHTQPVAHRQPTKANQAPTSAGRGAPGRSEQPNKKKKKKHGEDGR